MDSAYAHLAAWKLDPSEHLDKVLSELKASREAAPVERHYAQGLMERALGQSSEASKSFQQALGEAGNNILYRYLCQLALAETR